MAAENAKELIGLFAKLFAIGDIDGLLELYEEGTVFPNHHTTAQGHDQISAVLQDYTDSGAKLELDRQVAFKTGKIALLQNALTLTTVTGDEATA